MLKTLLSLIGLASPGWDELENKGRAAYAAGDFPAAESAFTKALKAAGDDDARSVSLSDLGLTHTAMRRFDDAARDFESAGKLAAQNGDRGMQATILDNVALMKKTQGDFRAAVASYEKATPIWREVGDKGELATNLNNLAIARMSLGDAAGALEPLKQAIAIWTELDAADPRLGPSLMSLGALQAQLGKYDDATVAILRGIDRIKSSPPDSQMSLGRAHTLLGDVQLAHGKTKEAGAAYGTAAAMLKTELGDSHPWTREAVQKASGLAKK